MRNIFSPDKGLWRALGVLGDLLILSMLWTLCSMPLVTIGGATAALYDAVVKCFRRGDTDYLLQFFRRFRAEWKRGILLSLFWGLLLGAFLFLSSVLLRGLSAQLKLVAGAVILVFFCLLLGACCWVFPMQSRFELRFWAVVSNAFRLALGRLPVSMALALGTLAAIWLTLHFALIPLMLLPALLALYWSWFIEPVFQTYQKE